jgi:hypothetical protein
MNSLVGRRDEALCEELRELATRLGVEVREEPLLREVGYHVHSGACRVHGRELIILERGLSASERIDVLVRGLLDRDFETHYLSPALRQLIETARGGSTA